MLWLGSERRRLGKNPVVYHCRGEATFSWGEKIAAKRAGDSIVVDIRGFWPIERLASQGVFSPDAIGDTQQAVFDTDVESLRYAISHGNMVTTVSAPLKDYLVQNYNAPDNTSIIPCCVNNVINDSQRDKVRQQLALSDKKAILYLGGTQKYQHLDDLVFPFFQSALAQSENCVAVFITQNMSAIQQLIEKFRLPAGRVRLISVPQQEVGRYLSAMDAGLLLRAPSFLNAFSQPVKLGEYLSAGLPVVVEKGTGSVQEMLAPYDIAFAVNIHNRSTTDLDAEVSKTLNWIGASNSSRREAARGFVEQHYTWKAYVQHERKMYMDSLAGTIAQRSKKTL
jgi:glycosyltransferase involved in cell wall biosynthesis